MKNQMLKILLFVFVFVLAIGFAEAMTLVAGKIYNADFTETIGGASVTVSCEHNNQTATKNTTSLADGTYAVTYNETGVGACDDGDLVTVDATKDNLFGSASGIVNENVVGTWDIAIVNVPLVPEFGLIVGMATILGALAVFYLIRK